MIPPRTHRAPFLILRASLATYKLPLPQGSQLLTPLSFRHRPPLKEYPLSLPRQSPKASLGPGTLLPLPRAEGAGLWGPGAQLSENGLFPVQKVSASPRRAVAVLIYL